MLQHREYQPHFAYLNDEMNMLLPAQMGYPFVPMLSGVAEMAYAIRQGRPHRMSKEMAYHAMEVLHGFDVSAETGSVYTLESTFSMPPLKEGYYSTMWGGYARADAECSLME